MQFKKSLVIGSLLASGIAWSQDKLLTETFTVEIEALSEGGQSDLRRLKEKAILQAKNEFPHLIEGQESLIDGEYQQRITSATMVYADAEIIDSTLNEQNTMLSGKVEVTLNLTKSLGLLHDLEQKRALEKKVSSSVQKIIDLMGGGVTKEELIQIHQLRGIVELALLQSPDVKLTEKLVSSRKDELISQRDNLMKEWSESAVWKITNLNPSNETMYVTVEGPNMDYELSSLIATYDEEAFGDDIGGKVCGVSRNGLHFMVDVFPLPTKNNYTSRNVKAAKEISFRYNYHGSQVEADVFASTFQIMPCY